MGTRTVVVAGSSGFLGTHLVRHLRHRGDTVRRLVRRAPAGPGEFSWDPGRAQLAPEALAGADAVVNLGGASLGRLPWTAAYREELRRSRTAGTLLLATAIARSVDAGARAPRLLQASGTDYYGDRGEEVLDESSGPGPGFFAEVCQAWEAATRPAADAGAPVALMRSGAVLAPEGGALAPMVRLLRLGLGGRLASGTQWFPWISLADHVRAQLHLIDSQITGPVNLVAAVPARQAELARAVAGAMGRHAPLAAPGPLLRLAGTDFADFLTGSRRVAPAALTGDGFEHLHATIADAAPWVAR